MFNAVIDLQLGRSASSTSFKGGMQSLDDFEGYESDRLCPVDPLCYCVLAAYYSSKQQPLRARKALVLANRSFIEGGYKPAATTHGLPRRTIVFCLARACDYLFANGFTALGTLTNSYSNIYQCCFPKPLQYMTPISYRQLPSHSFDIIDPIK